MTKKEITIQKADTGETQVCEGATFLHLEDFQDEERIQKMYANKKELLSTCKYRIIDVRANNGGSDSAFLPLLAYCLPEGKTLADVDEDDDEGMEK